MVLGAFEIINPIIDNQTRIQVLKSGIACTIELPDKIFQAG